MKREMCLASSSQNGQLNGVTFRRAHCAGCRMQFLVCRHCDRGHVYCGVACRAAARRASKAHSKQRELLTECGRQNHCDNSRDYRDRERKRVRDHGSAKLAIELKVSVSDVGEASAVAAFPATPPEPLESSNSSTCNTLKQTSEPSVTSNMPFASLCSFCGRPVQWERRAGWRSRRPPKPPRTPRNKK
jgi:hypothetical protein